MVFDQYRSNILYAFQYLPLPEKVLKQQAASRKMWQRQKTDAQQMMEEGRIEREQHRSERELKQDSSIYHILLFAFGSLTLSVLFALHTGILVVDIDSNKKGKDEMKK